MNGLPDLAIIAFAALIHATLQLGVGALLTLYHATLGTTIKKKAQHLGEKYILGVALFIALALASTCFLVLVIFSGGLPTASLVILVALLVLMTAAIWFLYYRKSSGTELWIPRSFAKFINERAKDTDDSVEAFSLGMTMACGEMPFAIILVIAAANSILALPENTQILAILLYVFIATLPMIILQVAVRKGETILAIQKWRIKNKNFIKIFSGFCFLILAAFIIAFKVLGQ